MLYFNDLEKTKDPGNTKKSHHKYVYFNEILQNVNHNKFKTIIFTNKHK